MDCTYSVPKDYQGNTPGTDLTAWNYSIAHCDITQFATPSGQSVASISAISFTPALNKTFHDMNIIYLLLLLLIMFILAFQLAGKLLK